MKTKKYLFVLVTLLLCITSCKETGRYTPDSGSGGNPDPVSNVTYKPLYGGARFYYDIPSSENLLSVDAEYTNAQNRIFKFSSSFYKDSLDVYGFADVSEYTVKLYAVNRTGGRSEIVNVSVTPLEPAFTRVAKSIIVKPGFSSLILDWANELEQNVNVYVDFSYSKNGVDHSFTSVFSSNRKEDRRFVNDLILTPQDLVSVQVRVEDSYGNITETIDQGKLALYEDTELAKDKWVLPNPNDSIGGIPMCFGNAVEGRTHYVIDGLIDRGDNLNFMHTGGRGRTGKKDNGNMPWNVMIDLGEHYELSRIITTQRHSGGLENINRGQYYHSENVGIYKMYRWDDATSAWEEISEHKILVPVGLSELEFVKVGEAGDMAYMFPDDPKYTKPTRWFRYEALKSFNANYTRDDANCLSEITLYGRKASGK